MLLSTLILFGMNNFACYFLFELMHIIDLDESVGLTIWFSWFDLTESFKSIQLNELSQFILIYSDDPIQLVVFPWLNHSSWFSWITWVDSTDISWVDSTESTDFLVCCGSKQHFFRNPTPLVIFEQNCGCPSFLDHFWGILFYLKVSFVSISYSVFKHFDSIWYE